MNIVSKIIYFTVWGWALYGDWCYGAEHVASADFAALEEEVRSNAGEIEELKRLVAELKEQIAQLRGNENKNSGETLFDKGNYKEASREFIKRYKKAKDHDGQKAAESLYRLAQCFKKLLDKKKAKTTLEKLISDYPKSSFSKRAKEELKNLK